jgi:diguanylate cyclase (GGDEF)-like protein
MDQYTLFVLLSPFGCTIAVAVAIYSWRRRTARAAKPLAFAMGAVAAYLVFNTLELVDTTPQGTLFFAQICYVCISVLTVNWLVFTLSYLNYENWLRSPFFRLTWIIPAITTVLVFTNSYHHLIWKEFTFIPVTNGFLYLRVIAYGSWFWVFWLQAYFLILISAVMMISINSMPRQYFHIQSRLATAAALLPLIVNMFYILRLIPGLIKDFSPLSYAFSGILMAISIFRYRMLDLTPLARSILIDNMNDGMLTLDTSKRLVDFNPAVLRIFNTTQMHAPQMGEKIPFLEPYLQQMENNSSVDQMQIEINLPQPIEDGYYDLQIRRLCDQRSLEGVGFLVLMHAITEHKKLLQAVRKLADEDTLTGLLNRSRFTELAIKEISYVRNSPQHFSLMIIDIDFFKLVNDSLGHIAGDQLLQAFTQRLCPLFRSTDLIGRIGGDEFIVMLPDTILDNAFQLAERLCKKIAESPIETKDFGALNITISVGVAEYVKGGSDSIEPVIALADKGLYQAKALGRNRVCVFDPSLDVQL